MPNDYFYRDLVHVLKSEEECFVYLNLTPLQLDLLLFHSKNIFTYDLSVGVKGDVVTITTVVCKGLSKIRTLGRVSNSKDLTCIDTSVVRRFFRSVS